MRAMSACGPMPAILKPHDKAPAEWTGRGAFRIARSNNQTSQHLILFIAAVGRWQLTRIDAFRSALLGHVVDDRAVDELEAEGLADQRLQVV